MRMCLRGFWRGVVGFVSMVIVMMEGSEGGAGVGKMGD
jgi:hypothetical protein